MLSAFWEGGMVADEDDFCADPRCMLSASRGDDAGVAATLLRLSDHLILDSLTHPFNSFPVWLFLSRYSARPFDIFAFTTVKSWNPFLRRPPEVEYILFFTSSSFLNTASLCPD